jgi:hypothetical protein
MDIKEWMEFAARLEKLPLSERISFYGPTFEIARLNAGGYIRSIVRPYGFAPALMITREGGLSLRLYPSGRMEREDAIDVDVLVLRKLWGTPELERYLRVFCILAAPSISA